MNLFPYGPPSLWAEIDAGLAAGLAETDPRAADASRCLQCGSCTPFCPAALETDGAFMPRRVTAAIADGRPLGLAIDECVQCRLCAVVCPRGVDVGGIVNAIYEARRGLRPFRELVRAFGMIPPSGFFPLYTRGFDIVAFAKKKAGYRRIVTEGARAELRALFNPGPEVRAALVVPTGHRPLPQTPVPDEIYGFQSCCAFNYPGIASSSVALLETVGIGVRRSDDETCCCGAPHYLGEIGLAEGVLVGARNLAVMAETAGADGVATGVGVCPTCYSTYLETLDRLENPSSRAAVNGRLSEIGRMVEPPSRYAVHHVVMVLDARRHELAPAVRGAFSGIRAGIHPSCHFRAATRDAREQGMLARLVALTGARHVPSTYGTYCCGGVKDLFARYLSGRRDRPSLLNREAVDARRRDGIDLVVVDCPGCMLVYDSLGVPVVHIAELMAVASGISPRRAGLSHHFTPVTPLLEGRNDC